MSSSKRNTKASHSGEYYYSNFMTEDRDIRRHIKPASDYYNGSKLEEKYRIKSSRGDSIKEQYENSYHNEDYYRSTRIRPSPAQVSERRQQYFQNKYHMSDSKMASLRLPENRVEVESDYDCIEGAPVAVTTKPYTTTSGHTQRDDDSTTCCGCVEITDGGCCSCYGISRSKNDTHTQTEAKQLSHYEPIRRQQNNYHEGESYSESYDGYYDSVYDDRHYLISDRSRINTDRSSYRDDKYARVLSRKPKFNPAKRHVAVQMNTKYVVHCETPKVLKPPVKSVSCQTVITGAPQPEMIIPHLPRRPSTPPGPVVISHVRREYSPEVKPDYLIKPLSNVVPYSKRPPSPEDTRGPILEPRIEVVPYIQRSPTPVEDPSRPRISTVPKNVPFIGEPWDPNETYETAYFEYKEKRSKKKRDRPFTTDIVVHETEPKSPVSVPVKEPPPEPEVVYYRDPSPEPVTPPTPSPPSTPPPRIKRIKVPKRKCKSIMTRVGGGWMKVEHHRNHHIPLTVYEHPRALGEDKFLYIKSKYTPESEKVPIAYKKYREIVIRNGKLG